MVIQLNEGQRATFDQVMATVNDTNDSVPQQYFFNGPGRTENNVPLQISCFISISMVCDEFIENISFLRLDLTTNAVL
jgi:hypothetical protein